MSSNNCILVVDDNTGICLLLSEVLKEEGYSVEVANNGLEAINKVLLSQPALILLDAKMPGMSGFKVLHEINRINSQIPVVMMSAYTELPDVQEAKKKGDIQYYLNKPFDFDRLKEVIKGIVSNKNGTTNNPAY
ncbi:MAG: response regulator [Peptococcaceae bacterium]|jgi:CheY-like chemotaxis protein|nr:response regulator [Peptococcaceae bacterium]